MSNALIVVDVQQGFINSFTEHIPERVARLIEQHDYDPIQFTRFINSSDGPYPRFMGWSDCATEPEINIAPELRRLASDHCTFHKDGYAGVPDKLARYLTDREIPRATIVGIDTDMCVLKVAMDIFDLNIEPIVLVDCCASTSGLQSHLAGLAVLARNIGADQLRDAGLSEGRLGTPDRVTR